MEKAWFYETLFFEVITVIVKDEKMQYKIYTISIKISFMHYMKWTRVMLPVVFEEFQMVFVFLIFFFFSRSLSIGKRSTLSKIWEGAVASSASPRFLRTWLLLLTL